MIHQKQYIPNMRGLWIVKRRGISDSGGGVYWSSQRGIWDLTHQQACIAGQRQVDGTSEAVKCIYLIKSLLWIIREENMAHQEWYITQKERFTNRYGGVYIWYIRSSIWLIKGVLVREGKNVWIYRERYKAHQWGIWQVWWGLLTHRRLMGFMPGPEVQMYIMRSS